jgi:glutaredoxin-like protein NrdH
MTKQLIVYSAKGCRDCDMVKEYLQEKEAAFEVRDIMEKKEYQDEVEKLGFMGIPVTAAGDQAVKGFNPGELNRLIDLTK